MWSLKNTISQEPSSKSHHTATAEPACRTFCNPHSSYDRDLTSAFIFIFIVLEKGVRRKGVPKKSHVPKPLCRNGQAQGIQWCVQHFSLSTMCQAFVPKAGEQLGDCEKGQGRSNMETSGELEVVLVGKPTASFWESAQDITRISRYNCVEVMDYWAWTRGNDIWGTGGSIDPPFIPRWGLGTTTYTVAEVMMKIQGKTTLAKRYAFKHFPPFNSYYNLPGFIAFSLFYRETEAQVHTTIKG